MFFSYGINRFNVLYCIIESNNWYGIFVISVFIPFATFIIKEHSIVYQTLIHSPFDDKKKDA